MMKFNKTVQPVVQRVPVFCRASGQGGIVDAGSDEIFHKLILLFALTLREQTVVEEIGGLYQHGALFQSPQLVTAFKTGEIGQHRTQRIVGVRMRQICRSVFQQKRGDPARHFEVARLIGDIVKDRLQFHIFCGVQLLCRIVIVEFDLHFPEQISRRKILIRNFLRAVDDKRDPAEIRAESGDDQRVFPVGAFVEYDELGGGYQLHKPYALA